MDFAPYQDTSPEADRALSPPPEDRRSFSPNIPDRRTSFSPVPASKPPVNVPAPNTWTFGGDGAAASHGARVAGVDSGRGRLNEFETSLPIRLDFEACLAYLLLPPAGGVLLLVMEHKSDYVRFHAWQSSLLFTATFVLHLILSWSSFLSWLLFVVDIGLIGFLTMRAYRDAETLDRFEVPFFGRLASKILDDE